MINFLWQIMFFMVFIVIAHSTWAYVQDQFFIKKKNDISNAQIEKYESIIKDLQNQNNEKHSEDKIKDKIEDDLIEYVDRLL